MNADDVAEQLRTAADSVTATGPYGLGVVDGLEQAAAMIEEGADDTDEGGWPDSAARSLRDATGEEWFVDELGNPKLEHSERWWIVYRNGEMGQFFVHRFDFEGDCTSAKSDWHDDPVEAFREVEGAGENITLDELMQQAFDEDTRECIRLDATIKALSLTADQIEGGEEAPIEADGLSKAVEYLDELRSRRAEESAREAARQCEGFGGAGGADEDDDPTTVLRLRGPEGSIRYAIHEDEAPVKVEWYTLRHDSFGWSREPSGSGGATRIGSGDTFRAGCTTYTVEIVEEGG